MANRSSSYHSSAKTYWTYSRITIKLIKTRLKDRRNYTLKIFVVYVTLVCYVIIHYRKINIGKRIITAYFKSKRKVLQLLLRSNFHI